MQVLILYYSKTGNTEKLARYIANGVKEVEGVNSIIKNTEEIKRENFIKSEGIIIGSPVYFGSMAAELKKILDSFIDIRSKMENKIGAAFATSGNHTGGKETTMFSIIQAMLIYGMLIVGDPMDASGHYGVAHSKNPDPKTFDNAIKLGQRVALIVKKLHHN